MRIIGINCPSPSHFSKSLEFTFKHSDHRVCVEGALYKRGFKCIQTIRTWASMAVIPTLPAVYMGITLSAQIVIVLIAIVVFFHDRSPIFLAGLPATTA